MKKILYITTSYTLKNSSAAIRNNSLVKGFTELGYEVDVYTVAWPDALVSDFFLRERNGRLHLNELPNLRRINRMKTKMNKPQKQPRFAALRKLAKNLLFFPDECGEWAGRFSLEGLEAYDYLITSSDHKSSHFVGLKVKASFPRIPWIQVWGDPWNTDVNTPWLLKRRTAGAERRLLEKADQVVYVSLPTCQAMAGKYPAIASKMHYIPRGYYRACPPGAPPGGAADDPHRTCSIVYTGVISYGRNIFPLLDVLGRQPQWREKVTIDIYGQYAPGIEKKLKQYPFVRLQGDADFDRMLPVYGSASMLLYLSNKSGSSQIPGKLYDYLGTTKPVLCLVADETDATSCFLKRFPRCCVICNDQAAIEDGWDKITRFLPTSYPIEQAFSPVAIATEFEKILG